MAAAVAVSLTAFVLVTNVAAVLYVARAVVASVVRPAFVVGTVSAIAAAVAESDHAFFAAASVTAAAAAVSAVVLAVCAAVFAVVASVTAFSAAANVAAAAAAIAVANASGSITAVRSVTVTPVLPVQTTGLVTSVLIVPDVHFPESNDPHLQLNGTLAIIVPV